MPKAKAYPDNWPSSIPYLSVPIIAPDLAKDILTTVAVTSPSLEPNAATINPPTVPYTNIRITPIHDHTHPAHGQCGLFTTQPHPPDSFICLYLGLVHATKADDQAREEHAATPAHQPKSDYDLSLDRDLGLAVDAANMGNEARFINDYRGIADRPNAEFRDVIIKQKGGKKERGVGVFVKAAKKAKKGRVRKEDEAGIAKGQEILVSYGRGFWSARRVEPEAEAEADADGVPC